MRSFFGYFSGGLNTFCSISFMICGDALYKSCAYYHLQTISNARPFDFCEDSIVVGVFVFCVYISLIFMIAYDPFSAFFPSNCDPEIEVFFCARAVKNVVKTEIKTAPIASAASCLNELAPMYAHNVGRRRIHSFRNGTVILLPRDCFAGSERIAVVHCLGVAYGVCNCPADIVTVG